MCCILVRTWIQPHEGREEVVQEGAIMLVYCKHRELAGIMCGRDVMQGCQQLVLCTQGSCAQGGSCSIPGGLVQRARVQQ